MDILILFCVVLLLICTLYFLVRSSRQLTQTVPEENRVYLDPLPPGLRALWPGVKFIEHHFGFAFPKGQVAGASRLLSLTGMGFMMTERQFVALSFVSALVCVVLAISGMWALHRFSLLALVLAALLGYFIPRMWVKEKRKKNYIEVNRQLPLYLDLLTLGVEAGLNVNVALGHAVEKGPRGALYGELEHVIRDIKSGVARADAFRRMDMRLSMPEVSSFVSALIQAERMGSGIGLALRAQAEQRRHERFLRAETAAMEAPIKLIFPLVVFIFPVTFIVLFFPIAMKFLQSGVL